MSHEKTPLEVGRLTVRSADELIAELDAEGRRHDSVALIIAFEISTLPIFSTDQARRMLLHEALSLGGHPMGLIAVDQTGREPRLKIRIDPGYSGASAQLAKTCLHELSLILGESLKPSRRPSQAQGRSIALPGHEAGMTKLLSL
jgi:hypothetical protein